MKDYRTYIIDLTHKTLNIPKIDLYVLHTNEIIDILYNREK